MFIARKIGNDTTRANVSRANREPGLLLSATCPVQAASNLTTAECHSWDDGELMFELQQPARKVWPMALGASFALHIAALLLMMHRPAVTVLPSEVALGTRYSSGSVTYLAPLGRELARTTAPPELRKKSLIPPAAPRPRPVDRSRELAKATAPDAPTETAHAGSPWGSHVPGSPLTGPEIMPALPQVFPDPPVSRADIPAGVEGDVIVEVTIDAQGNVVETKLLKGIGYGVEEKVIAVLQRWHFRPAMQNGVTIASQHIVHFHYPS